MEFVVKLLVASYAVDLKLFKNKEIKIQCQSYLELTERDPYAVSESVPCSPCRSDVQIIVHYIINTRTLYINHNMNTAHDFFRGTSSSGRTPKWTISYKPEEKCCLRAVEVDTHY